MRRLILFAVLLTCLGLVGKDAHTEVKYPEKPIKLIVPYEAGGTADIMIRPLAEKVSAKLGVPVMVINKPGAGGSIGGREIYGSKPDGYTIGSYMGMLLYKLQGVTPFGHRDFDMIGIYNIEPVAIVVNAKRPWKSIKEVIEYAKLHPMEIKAATSSKGAYFWLGAVLFEKATGTKLNIIPQTGAGGMVTIQTAGGHVDLGFADVPAMKAMIDAGNLRLLAIMGSERLEDYKDVPTLKELGYDVEVSTPRPVIAPKGMPKAVFDSLVRSFGEAAQSPEYKKFARQANANARWLSGEQGLKIYDEQEKLFRPILEEAGLLKIK